MAIEKDPRNHKAFYNRAMAYQMMGDVESAIRDYSITLLMEEDSVYSPLCLRPRMHIGIEGYYTGRYWIHITH
jgi:tetratricopeptide (TPR) repeat protein